MPDDDLNAFLSEGGEPAPAPEPEPKEPAAPPEPKAEPDEDAPPTSPDGRTVPLAALEAERAQRRDHKERAARLEGELAELRRQFDEAKRAPQQRQEPQQPAWINPTQDPGGFVERVQQVVLNERLNSSEMMLRREMGAEAVDAAIADFKQAAQQDPTLFPKLYQQSDPYGWMAKHVEVLRLRRDIGDDPAAYKARLRAEWEAERGTSQEAPQQAPISPAARLAPSLANARSAAPRGAPAYSGPTDLDDIVRR